MADDAPLLSFHDALLYEADLALFTNPAWLNDNCVNFYLSHVQHAVLGNPGSVLMLDPCVVSCLMLQCDDDEEVAELAQGLALAGRELILVPISNAESFATNGSHWGLLQLTVQAPGISARYWDSSAGMNRPVAERVLQKLWPCVAAAKGFPGNARVPFLDSPPCPQQENGYDCGMYAVMLAEQLACDHVGMDVEFEEITAESVRARRGEMEALVRGLAAAEQQ